MVACGSNGANTLSRRLVVLWVLATCAGWTVGESAISGDALLTAIDSLSGYADMLSIWILAISQFVFGAVGGVIVGFGQGLILRNLGRQGDRWFWVTLVGMSVGWGLSGIIIYGNNILDTPTDIREEARRFNTFGLLA